MMTGDSVWRKKCSAVQGASNGEAWLSVQGAGDAKPGVYELLVRTPLCNSYFSVIFEWRTVINV